MVPVESIVRGVVIPVAVSTIVLVALARPWRDATNIGGRAFRHLAGALAVAVGYLTGHLALTNGKWPRFPLPEATDWPLFLVPLALVVTVLSLRGAGGLASRSGQWTTAGVLVTTTVLAVGLAILRHGPDAPALVRCAALVAGGLAFWWAAEGVICKITPPAAWTVFTLTLSGASLALVIAGSALLGQLVGALAAALGPLIVVLIWRPGLRLLPPLFPLLSVVLIAVWSAGVFYLDTDLSLIGVCVLLSTAAAALAASHPRLRQWNADPHLGRRLAGALLPVMLTLMFAAAAVALALRSSPPLEYY